MHESLQDFLEFSFFVIISVEPSVFQLLLPNKASYSKTLRVNSHLRFLGVNHSQNNGLHCTRWVYSHLWLSKLLQLQCKISSCNSSCNNPHLNNFRFELTVTLPVVNNSPFFHNPAFKFLHKFTYIQNWAIYLYFASCFQDINTNFLFGQTIDF